MRIVILLMVGLCLFGCGGSSGSSPPPPAWNATLASVARDPDVKVSPAGQGLVVWWQYNADSSASSIMAKWLNGGAASVISSGGYAIAPVVGFNAVGDAVAVWAQSDDGISNIWANRYTAGSGWGTPVRVTDVIADDPVSVPSLGVDDAGNAIVTWYQVNSSISFGHNDIWASRYSVTSGSWSAPAIVSDGLHTAYNSKVAVNQGGALVLVWIQSEDDGSGSIAGVDAWGATGTTTAGWGIPARLNSVLGSEYEVSWETTVAIDSAGGAMAAWIQKNSSGVFDVWTSHLTPGGGWAPSLTISSGISGDCSSPVLSLDGSGTVFAAWVQKSLADDSQGVTGNIFSSGTGWGTPIPISPSGGDSFDPHLATDASGKTNLVWYQEQQGTFTIRSNRYLPTQGWGTSEIVATTNTDGITTYPVPRVGMNASGQSFIVWGIDSL